MLQEERRFGGVAGGGSDASPGASGGLSPVLVAAGTSCYMREGCRRGSGGDVTSLLWFEVPGIPNL